MFFLCNSTRLETCRWIRTCVCVFVCVCITKVWWCWLLTNLPGTNPGTIFLSFLHNTTHTPSVEFPVCPTLWWSRTDRSQLQERGCGSTASVPPTDPVPVNYSQHIFWWFVFFILVLTTWHWTISKFPEEIYIAQIVDSSVISFKAVVSKICGKMITKFNGTINDYFVFKRRQTDSPMPTFNNG